MSRSYPALGFDPAPGDPDEVARAARELARAAAELARLADEVTRLSDVSGAWRGVAAEAFAESATVLPHQLRSAATAFGAAAARLTGWSGELAVLQAEARAAERQAAAAQSELLAARAHVDVFAGGAPTPFGVHDRATLAALEQERAARARGEDVGERARAASLQVARAVREAARAAPPAPVLQRLVRWSDAPFGVPVGAWVRGHEPELLAVADGSAVGATAAARLPLVGAALAAGLGGLTLVSHAGVALYADGSVKDVALDVAGSTIPAASGLAATGGALLRSTQLPLDTVAAGLTVSGLQDIVRRRVPPLMSERPPASPAPPPAECGPPEQREQDARSRGASRDALQQTLVQPLSPAR